MSTNVLVLDDDDAINYFYTRALTRSGKVGQTVVFENAQDALDYLTSDAALPIGLILLDISMPRMDGFQFADALVSLAPRTIHQCTVIMLTASINPRDQQRVDKHTLIKKLLSKPHDQAAMRDIIDAYCK